MDDRAYAKYWMAEAKRPRPAGIEEIRIDARQLAEEWCACVTLQVEGYEPVTEHYGAQGLPCPHGGPPGIQGTER